MRPPTGKTALTPFIREDKGYEKAEITRWNK